MITIDCSGKRLALYGAFVVKEDLRQLVGSAWNDPKGTLAWTLPFSPAGVGGVHYLLNNLGEVYRVTGNQKKFDECLRIYNLQKMAAKFKDKEFPLPPFPIESKTFIPRRNQAAAFHFTKHLPASILWLPMGHGKSRVAIDLIEYRKHSRVLIICTKAAVKSVWPEQIQVHSNLSCTVCANDSPKVSDRFEDAVYKLETSIKLNNTYILVINHSSVWREPFLTWILKKASFEYLVVDECHKGSSASSSIGKFLQKLQTVIPWRIGLSGTPLQDKPMDAYGLYKWLDPGILGTSISKFQDQFCVMGGYKGKQFFGLKTAKRDEFIQRIFSIAYAADSSEIDIPPITVIDIKFSLSDKVYSMYLELEEEFILELKDATIVIQNQLVKVGKLHQLCNGYMKDGEFNILIHEEKCDILIDILDGISTNEQVPIFYKFQNDLKLIEKACELSGRSICKLNGQYNQLEEWKLGTYNVIAIQISAGSNSIDLTKSCYFIYFSLTFSLTDYLQSFARLARPPQLRPVTCYRILAKNTVDITISRALDKKKNVMELILEEGLKIND